MVAAFMVQRDRRLKTGEDYIISQDTDQWEKSNSMNRTANRIIKDEWLSDHITLSYFHFIHDRILHEWNIKFEMFQNSCGRLFNFLGVGVI